MLNKNETNDHEDKTDIQTKHKACGRFVRVKRITKMSRKTPNKLRNDVQDGCADCITMPKEVTTHVGIGRTFSFDDDNVYSRSGNMNECHLARLRRIHKRKADQDNDSTTLRDLQKRVKLDEDENVYGSSSKSDRTNSKFRPDCNLVVSWL